MISVRRWKLSRICRVRVIRPLAVDTRQCLAFKLRSEVPGISMPHFCASAAWPTCFSWTAGAKHAGHVQDPHSWNHGGYGLRRVQWTFAAGG